MVVSNIFEYRKFHMEQFRQDGLPDAEFEYNCILEQVAGMPWYRIREISPDQLREMQHMTERRISGEPLQYILGEWEFYGMKFFVGKGVLIPRPDTECLIDLVSEKFGNLRNLKILDLCTGSGCIALVLKKIFPDADVTGIDLSPDALAYAAKNKAYHALDVKFLQGNVMDSCLPENFDVFDLIISNPPYLTSQEMQILQTEVSHEPEMALHGGVDGLNFYRGITRIWKSKLKSRGLLLYEIGEQQGAAVSEILQMQDFENVKITQDLAHRDRIVSGNKI